MGSVLMGFFCWFFFFCFSCGFLWVFLMHQTETRNLYCKDIKLISAWELQVYKCTCQCTVPQEWCTKKKPPSTKETQPKKLLKTITKNDLDYHGINVQHMSHFWSKKNMGQFKTLFLIQNTFLVTWWFIFSYFTKFSRQVIFNLQNFLSGKTYHQTPENPDPGFITFTQSLHTQDTYTEVL